MKTATVRELRTEFPRLEALLSEGESIAITKHKRVVAKLVPADRADAPDFKARFGVAAPLAEQREKSVVTLLVGDRGE
jgi:antitoxin (DNA-binding transcriptional repressor) of toxin-antitoxin stability system